MLIFGAPAACAAAGSTSGKPQVFAENLEGPYGIAFVPPGNPQYVYVAVTKDGDLLVSDDANGTIFRVTAR